MVATLALLLVVGPLSLWPRRAWWDGLDRTAWVPNGTLTVVSAVAVAALEGGALAMVFSDHGWSLPVYLWLSHAVLSPMWWMLVVGRRRLSAGFTMLCVDWTALAMAAAAFWAFTPGAGWLLGASLGWLTWLGASLYVLWQANQPSRR